MPKVFYLPSSSLCSQWHLPLLYTALNEDLAVRHHCWGGRVVRFGWLLYNILLNDRLLPWYCRNPYWFRVPNPCSNPIPMDRINQGLPRDVASRLYLRLSSSKVYTLYSGSSPGRCNTSTSSRRVARPISKPSFHARVCHYRVYSIHKHSPKLLKAS